MELKKQCAAGVIAVLAATSLAACGQGDGNSDTATIKVMTIAPQGTDVVNFDSGVVAKAYAKAANAGDGINGAKIEVIACNDEGDPNKAANCARDAVRNKVVAVVGGFSQGESAIVPVLDQAGIAYIGSNAISAESLTSKVSFPIQAGPIAFADLAGVAAQSCKKTVPVLLDTPTGAGVLPFMTGPIQKAGKTLGATIKIPTTAVEFSSVANALKPYDCAVGALPVNVNAPLLAAMAELGVKTRLLLSGATVDTQLLKDHAKQLEGSFTNSSFASFDDPAWDDAKAAVASDADLTNVVLQNTWVSMLVFDHVASGINGAVTAKSVLAAMSAADKVDTGGLTPPLNFTQGLPIPQLARITNPTALNFVIKDGKRVPLGGFVDMRAALAALAG